MTYREEFPDFSESDMPEIPAGFVDVSSELDLCPSFWSEPLRLRISVDYADPERRDDPDMPRFCLWPTDPLGASDPDGEVFDGDDWSTILQRIEQYRAASEICYKWLSRIGDEFDPNTRGNEYTPHMSDGWMKEYDSDMKTLLGLPADPYALIETPQSAKERREMERQINAPPIAIYRSAPAPKPEPKRKSHGKAHLVRAPKRRGAE